MSPANKNTPVNPVRYQIRGIELLDFCFNHLKQQIPPQMTFNFDIKLEHKIPSDNNLLIVIVTIDIRGEDKTVKLGSLMASCVYEVPDIKDYFDKKTNLLNLPEAFITTLNSITISTVRGIMFSQYRGTFLHNAVLPIVDPKSFLPQK